MGLCMLYNNLSQCNPRPASTMYFTALSVIEHLEMISHIKGVPKHDVDRQVKAMIDEVSVHRYRYSIAGE